MPDSSDSKAVVSPSKKAKEEEELKLRREQEAKNKLLQQQKQNLNQEQKLPQLKQNLFGSGHDAATEFKRTLSSTFDLKFFVWFFAFFLLAWLFYGI